LLAFGFWWAVKTGKRLNQAEALKERVDKVANVNKFNRREDEELNSQIQNLILLSLVRDKQRMVCRQRYGVLEKFTVEHS
jgi:uncharacterized phage infection (PIP) family protein YhgE